MSSPSRLVRWGQCLSRSRKNRKACRNPRRPMRLGLEPLEPRLLLAQVHSGSIAADETWTAADVHRITGDVTVEPGVTLTIEAGAIVQFDSSSRDLFVKGTLLAPGTVDNPILFTSLKDDTGPDGVLGTADDVDTVKVKKQTAVKANNPARVILKLSLPWSDFETRGPKPRSNYTALLRKSPRSAIQVIPKLLSGNGGGPQIRS